MKKLYKISYEDTKARELAKSAGAKFSGTKYHAKVWESYVEISELSKYEYMLSPRDIWAASRVEKNFTFIIGILNSPIEKDKLPENFIEKLTVKLEGNPYKEHLLRIAEIWITHKGSGFWTLER